MINNPRIRWNTNCRQRAINAPDTNRKINKKSPFQPVLLIVAIREF